MLFEFATANRIIFGVGTINELAPAALALGRRALLVMGRSTARAAAPRAALEAAGVSCVPFHVHREPSVTLVEEGVRDARTNGCDTVISIGGGSTIDAGKAIAALLPNPGDIHDYLEVVGKGQALPRPALPFIAAPTTAGTGSEVTRNAVLTVPEARVKVSLRGPTLLPRLAIVDPEMTFDSPPAVTAASGLDALAQLIEPFLSTGANPMTDALCRDGIPRIARSIRRACAQGRDGEARGDMSLASLFSGLALANAKLGAVHGFAGPIGGLFEAPHGAVCGRLLPEVLEANLRALRRRQPGSEVLRRFAELARLMTHQEGATADDGLGWLRKLCSDFGIPPLHAYGMESTDLAEVVRHASRSSSMKGNPIELNEDELLGILQAAL